MALLLLPVGRLVQMGQKQKSHLCGGNRNSIFFVRWEKNKKHWVGNECRLTLCPILIWFVCLSSPVKMVYFFLCLSSFLSAVSCRFTLAGNVWRVAAVGDFGVLHCQPAQKFDSSTQLQFCTSPPIEATRCYSQWFLSTVLENHCLYCVSLSLMVNYGKIKRV